ncbi:Gram Domain-Containing Protein 2A [Manis pentadactyla]|nr:Gram Domain-Containing Protein 2A [Manis pentadactyla]
MPDGLRGPLRTAGFRGVDRAGGGQAALTHAQPASQPAAGARESAGRRFLGHATGNTDTTTARTLLLVCLFPPDLQRAHAPPPSLKDSSASRKRPFSASSSIECAKEKGGGRSRRKRCRRHYLLFLRCSNLDVLPTSRLFAAYR